jgi:queuine tRNA-ribosyltransferase
MQWAARSREALGIRPGHALFGIQQDGLEQVFMKVPPL